MTFRAGTVFTLSLGLIKLLGISFYAISFMVETKPVSLYWQSSVPFSKYTNSMEWECSPRHLFEWKNFNSAKSLEKFVYSFRAQCIAYTLANKDFRLVSVLMLFEGEYNFFLLLHDSNLSRQSIQPIPLPTCFALYYKIRILFFMWSDEKWIIFVSIKLSFREFRLPSAIKALLKWKCTCSVLATIKIMAFII